MYLTCQYNGNELYSNSWDLCTVEDGEPDRVIFCPIKAGRRKFVKPLKIPNYLPKVYIAVPGSKQILDVSVITLQMFVLWLCQAAGLHICRTAYAMMCVCMYSCLCI